MSTIRSIQVPEPGGPFTLVEGEQREPDRGQVRLTVEACGICLTDAAFVHGGFPGMTFPIVPGHEVAGRIDAIGADVEGWEVGQRVTVGWFGGHCGTCRPCREGDFIHCAQMQVPSWAYPGGFAESMVAPASALARIPDALSAVDAAPMGCAGVATFNALRHSPARPGDLVAVLGIGGLGHLGVQFAAKSGFEVVAIARGAEKESAARELGAHHYIDSTTGEVAGALQALGGASVVLATAANADAMSATVDGLRPRGELIVLGATPEPIAAGPFSLIMGSRRISGHPSGTAADVEDTLKFAALQGIRPLTETAPLEEAETAFKRTLSGDARFRMVLTTGR
jgi:alcohol dehydrogenase